MHAEIQERALRAITEKTFPGAVVGIVHSDGRREVLPFGNFAYDENPVPVQSDTMYDVASVTKTIPTAMLALRLIDQGRLSLHDHLIRYVPEFRNTDRESITIKHLLTYTLGGYALSALKEKTAVELYESIMTLDFTVKPGSAFFYSNVPAFLLGLVNERVMGASLDKIADSEFFEPLGMTRTSFWPQYYSRDEIAPTEIENWRGHVQGSVHDESAYVFTVLGPRAVGHAGIFSCVPDLLTFMEMILRGGEMNGRQYISREMIEHMTTNQIAELDSRTGLGWQLQESWMGRSAHSRTFGKTGFTGTSCMGDMERGVALVILSNRTWPRRPEDGRAIANFRADIADIVLH